MILMFKSTEKVSTGNSLPGQIVWLRRWKGGRLVFCTCLQFVFSQSNYETYEWRDTCDFLTAVFVLLRCRTTIFLNRTDWPNLYKHWQKKTHEPDSCLNSWMTKNLPLIQRTWS